MALQNQQQIFSPLGLGQVESAHYDCVLRSIFNEIFLLNFSDDSYRAIYKGEKKFLPLTPDLPLRATLALAAAELVHPDEREEYRRLLNCDVLTTRLDPEREDHLRADVRKLCTSGYRWARLYVFALACSTLEQVRYMVCIRDIDEEKRAELIARENDMLQGRHHDNLRYKTVLDHTNTMVFEWHDTQATYTSPRIPAYLSGSYNGRRLFDIWQEDKVLYPGDTATFEKFLHEMSTEALSGETVVRLRRRSGSFTWCKVNYTCLEDGNGELRRIGTISDVDAATRAEQTLRFRAEYDSLTGSYNMQTFFEKAGQELQAHQDTAYQIVRFDVAGFKSINEMFGLEEGDRLLRAIAHLVRENLRKDTEVFGRLSGDIFAVCLTGGRARAEEFVEWLSHQVEDYTQAYRVKLFFGICTVDSRKTPVHILCNWAYLALNTVKGSDIVNYAFYEGELRKRMLDDNYIQDQMYDALEKRQFVLNLQPKVEISSGRIMGAESLARWLHPVDGLIMPGRFVPLFERNGFILRLDEYIWEETCKMLRLWLDKGYRPTPVSVNVSRMHFNNDNFWRKLPDLTDKYNLPPHLLELELTESAFFESEKTLQRVMQEMQEAGFVFSMDDFGTGYSSLSTLRSLPFNIVKLDRAFISDDNARGQVVTRNTIQMAKQLNMHIIAEGVETLSQALFLLECGCNYAQGYYYARPVDVDEFELISFVQDKPFWVDPLLQKEARKLGLPLGDACPDREH